MLKFLKYMIVGLVLSAGCFVPRPQKPSAKFALQELSLGWVGEDTADVCQIGFGSSSAPDGEITFDIPIVINGRVEFFLDYFQNEARQSFSTYLRRSSKYIDPMRNILERHGLPKDLVYLVLIESGFNPFAYSRAHAMGPWQFLAGTARIYGLRRNAWVDERRDPIKSTEAAARYLKDLYQIFNDWYLVLAAYNAGQYRVLRAINEVQNRSYWALDLPSQTEEFVPRFVAAAIIAKNPVRYGFDIEYERPVDHELVLVGGRTDLKIAAACMGCEVGLLRELNPELRRLVTPPDEPAYPLRIPRGAKERFSLCSENLVEQDGLSCRPQG